MKVKSSFIGNALRRARLVSLLSAGASLITWQCMAGVSNAADKVEMSAAASGSRSDGRGAATVKRPKAFDRFSPQPTSDEISKAHILQIPLKVAKNPNALENAAMARTLERHSKRSLATDFSAITEFLSSHPDSPWSVSLLCNLAKEYYESGRFTKSLETWEAAWSQAHRSSEPGTKAYGDYALAELAKMNARLGRYDRLEQLLNEARERKIQGAATQVFVGAAEGFEMMKHRPQLAYRCGPMAIGTIFRMVFPEKGVHPSIYKAESDSNGTSLAQVQDLASTVGLSYQMAKRTAGAKIVTPSVVHWRAGHFAALTKREDGKSLIEDPTFGDSIWISDEALDEEATGYFLIPSGELPRGWTKVERKAGEGVWGKGSTSSTEDNAVRPYDLKTGNNCAPSFGMATAAAHLSTVSLNLVDTPLFYDPPRGPAIRFTATYNQREINQPVEFNFSNLGHKWTFDWLSYLVVNSTSPQTNVLRYVAGGGAEVYKNYNSATSTYAAERNTQAILVRISSTSYERRLVDGGKELYDISDSTVGNGRRVFLRQVIDPQGNSLTFNYDDDFRLIEAIDALGQVTTIEYELPDDIYKITKVTDRFGRSATFEYNAEGLLAKITDVMGMSSEFTYDIDFLKTLKTPYGTSVFAYGDASYDVTLGSNTRWLDMKDPSGGKERVEYNQSTLTGADNVPAFPAGVYVNDEFIFARNTFYWDKKAMMEGAGDYSKAHIYHWLHYDGQSVTGPILESEKPALEARKFYGYPGQSVYAGGNQFSFSASFEGNMRRPAFVARVAEDGSTQIFRYEYNTLGRITKMTDPVGRILSFVYATNDIDLVEVRNTSNGTNSLLFAATYNAAHRPLTVTDAAGQTVTRTYNGFGQELTRTRTRSGVAESTTFDYDIDGYLLNVTGAIPGAVTNFSYDDFGRVETVTDPNGDTVSYQYDALNRETTQTYPDGSYEYISYHRLDPEWLQSRDGQWTHQFFDSERQLSRVDDPAGRSTVLDWCLCGCLHSIKDGEGRMTRFAYDLSKRVTQKTFADGSSVQFAYGENLGFPLSRLDARGQKAKYSFNLDGNVKEIKYVDVADLPLTPPTPTVSFYYDTNFNRVTSMVDGNGTTSFQYYPIGVGILGAGRVSSVDGPLVDDTVSYAYDERGVAVNTTINGVAEQISYDALDRIVGISNPIGAFVYSYSLKTGEVSEMSLINKISTELDYFGSSATVGTGNGGHRRKSIINKWNGVSQSRHDYTYGPGGEISSWKQVVAGSPDRQYSYSYNAIDELTSATLMDIASSSVLKQFTYGYDRAGNRTGEQVDNSVSTSGYNQMNELSARDGAGPLVIEGTVNEAANVTVGGQAVAVNGSNRFKASVQVSPGVQSILITATDPNGNSTNKTAEFVVTAGTVGQSLGHDDNGNLSADGTRIFQWDAENRLVAIDYVGASPAERTEFKYNGYGEVVKISELSGGVVVSEKNMIWVGGRSQPSELRDGSNTVLRRWYRQGFQSGSDSFYYMRDHLGSVREVVDSVGLKRAEYEFDPYGNRSLNAVTSNPVEPDFGFTGLYRHGKSGLHLARNRVYSADFGRWISANRLDGMGDFNPYRFSGNSPVNRGDDVGLSNVRGNVTSIYHPKAAAMEINDRNSQYPMQAQPHTGNYIRPDLLVNEFLGWRSRQTIVNRNETVGIRSPLETELGYQHIGVVTPGAELVWDGGQGMARDATIGLGIPDPSVHSDWRRLAPRSAFVSPVLP